MQIAQATEIDTLLQPIADFLRVETPQAWIQQATENIPDLLIDHANCEKKAASHAMSLIYKYVEHSDLLVKMSRLAREELHHFEQVLGIMYRRGISYKTLSASRYAAALRRHVRQDEPDTLVDKLIIGSIIEARSCERFALLAPFLDDELKRFYISLLRSEARHYQDYLQLAQDICQTDIQDRTAFLLDEEALLITSNDSQFRFHSGILRKN